MPPVTASSTGITRQTIDDPELVELIDCLSRFDVLGNAGLLFPPELDPNNAAAEHPKVDIDGLTAELAKWQTWRFQEQVDLYEWIHPLNVMDAALTDFMITYPSLLLISPSIKTQKGWARTRPNVVIDNSGDNRVQAESLEDVSSVPNSVNRQICIILRFLTNLLRNATNKVVFHSVDEVVDLLGAADDAVASLALEVLSSLATMLHRQQAPEVQHQSTVHHSRSSEAPARLLALARGWGSRGTGLGLYTCATADDSVHGQGALPRYAGELNFEYYFSNHSYGDKSPSRVISIHLAIDDIINSVGVTGSTDSCSDTDGEGASKPKRRRVKSPGAPRNQFITTKSTAELFFKCLAQAGGRECVPTERVFTLLADVRLAKSFHSNGDRVAGVERRLRALVAILHSHPSQDVLSGYFAAQPALCVEFVDLVKPTVSASAVSSGPLPPGSIGTTALAPGSKADRISAIAGVADSPIVPYIVRTLAIETLTALVLRRDIKGGLTNVSRQSNVLSELGVGKGRFLGLLPTLIRYALASLNSFLTRGNIENGPGRDDLKIDGALKAEDPDHMCIDEEDDLDINLGLAFLEATKPPPLPPQVQEERVLEFIDAVLTLTSAVISVPLGTSALTDCGFIPALISTVALHSDASRLDGSSDGTKQGGISYSSCLMNFITAQAIQILEGGVVTHGNALTAFHDLKGVNVLVRRFDLEVQKIERDGDEPLVAVARAGGVQIEIDSAPTAGNRPLRASRRVLLFSIVNCLTVVFHQQESSTSNSIAKKHERLLSLKNHDERFPQCRNRRRPCKHSCQRLHVFLILALLCLPSRLLKANTRGGNGVFSSCFQNLFSSAFIPARNTQRLHLLNNMYPQRKLYFFSTSRNQNVLGKMQPVCTNQGTQRQILFVGKKSDEKVEIGEAGNDDAAADVGTNKKSKASENEPATRGPQAKRQPKEDALSDDLKEFVLSDDLKEFVENLKDKDKTDLLEELDIVIKKVIKDEYKAKSLTRFLSDIVNECKLDVAAVNETALEEAAEGAKEGESPLVADASGKVGDTNIKVNKDDQELTPIDVLRRISTKVKDESILEKMQIIGITARQRSIFLKDLPDTIPDAIELFEQNPPDAPLTKIQIIVNDLTKFVESKSEKFLASKVDEALVQINAYKRTSKEQVIKTLGDIIEGELPKDEFLKYKKGLVETKCMAMPRLIDRNFVSKAMVWVVAGESGSGKSTYGMKMFEKAPVLRHSLTTNDLINTPPQQTQYSSTLQMFLELVTKELFNNSLNETQIYSDIRAVVNSINARRDEWALELAKELLKNVAEDTNCHSVIDWYKKVETHNQGENGITLDALVVVFDECGRSPEFSAGIIAKGRDLLKFLNPLAKELALVLCGSGMEVVKTGSTGNRYLVSDPALTQVITMVKTNLACLDDTTLQTAIEQGVYSRIVATNARMLTTGVIPALKSTLVTQYEENGFFSDRDSRLKAFCSFRYAMDLSLRTYVNLNALATDTNMRSKLLDKTFQYMAKSALKSAVTSLNNSGLLEKIIEPRLKPAKSLLQELGSKNKEKDEGTVVTEEDIFHIGLATRDLSQTSNALRYLACKGKTAPVYVADGASFENVVAIHLQRYSESIGIQTGFEQLRSAWPPAAEKNAGLDKEENVNKKVSAMLKIGNEDVNMIVKFFNDARAVLDCKQAALVLRQGVPNAQGPDVMKFEANYTENRLEVSLYQAKNWAKTRSNTNMKKAAKSLGVDAETKDCVPVTGSAGYSYQAMRKMCKTVAEGMGMRTEIVKRVIVFAYKASERSPSDDEDIGNGVELWSREMLEPTISALVVARDEDDKEKIIEDEKNGSEDPTLSPLVEG